MAMANLPASGQGGAKGRGWAKKELLARCLIRLYPSITEVK